MPTSTPVPTCLDVFHILEQAARDHPRISWLWADNMIGQPARISRVVGYTIIYLDGTRNILDGLRELMDVIAELKYGVRPVGFDNVLAFSRRIG